MPMSRGPISPQLGRCPQEGGLEFSYALRLPRKCRVPLGKEAGEGLGPRLVVPERGDLVHQGRHAPVGRPAGRRQLADVPLPQRVHLGRHTGEERLELRAGGGPLGAGLLA
jgi:hypothetical protein